MKAKRIFFCAVALTVLLSSYAGLRALNTSNSESSHALLKQEHQLPTLTDGYCQKFWNHTRCNLGEVVFYYPSSDSISIFVPDSGIYTAPTPTVDSAVAVKVLGVKYLRSGGAHGLTCNSEAHTLHGADLGGGMVYSGGCWWETWELNGRLR